MKILRLSTLSLSLAIAVFSLGYVNPSFAEKPNCEEDSSHPSCKPSDDGSPSENLSATFCLTIEVTDSQYIVSDGDSPPPLDPDVYCADRKEKVAVGTGSGDGFRWDTNMQNTNKTQQYMRWRLVHLSIVNDPFDDNPPDPPTRHFEIDFRFNQTIGLDLGSLVIDGDPGFVAASMQYYAGLDVLGYDFMNYGMLGFGALNAPNPTGDADCLNAAGGAGMIKVTRISGTQWTLESPQIGKACRFALDANGDRCTLTNSCDVDGQMPEMIDFEFLFTITQQE